MRTANHRYRRTRRYSRRSKTRYMRKTRRQRRTKILFAVFVIMLLAACGMYYEAYVDTDVYRDSEEFAAYADGELTAGRVEGSSGKHKTEYQFGEPISYAVDHEAYENEMITSFRDQQTQYIKTAFEEAKTTEEEKREKKYGDRFGYKPLSHALIISSGVYESSNGVISLVINERSSTEKDKAMRQEYAAVYTYQFSAETGEPLMPAQIFNKDYRQVCETYFSEYFTSSYEEGALTENWQSYITASDTNYNEFAVTENEVMFFFGEGTVLRKSRGPVSASITLEEMGDSLRSSIMERYIDPGRPMVALTYDDGPGGKSETRILDCLEKNEAVATFFYQGYRISGNEDKIKRAYEMGCEVGNHTWNHPVLTDLSKNRVKKQIVNTNQAIYKACGEYPAVFRPSYGITNGTINKISEMPVIMWSIDPEDWKSRNAKKIVKHIRSRKKLDGQIILLHSIYDSTAEATEILVPWLIKEGYQLVTVTELLEYRYGTEPESGQVYR